MTIEQKKVIILDRIKEAFSSGDEAEILRVTDKVLAINDFNCLMELSEFILQCDIERNKKVKDAIFKKIS